MLSKEYIKFCEDMKEYANQKCSCCGQVMGKCKCSKEMGTGYGTLGKVLKTPNPDKLIDKQSKIYFRKRRN